MWGKMKARAAKGKAAAKAVGKAAAKGKAKVLTPAGKPTSKVKYSDMLQPTGWKASQKNSFTSRAYHTANGRAKAAGRSPEECRKIAQQACASAANAWRNHVD